MKETAELQDKLQTIGLTQNEARVYLGLHRLQETKTGPLCEQTGIASSNIYHLLDKLINRGLASYRVQNNTKIYMPAPPKALNDLYQDKKRQLEQQRQQVQQLIDTLEQRQPDEHPWSNYKYYEGKNGVKSMWHEINDIMDSSMTLKVHTARRESYERLITFYDNHHEKRAEQGIPEQMIFPIDDTELAKERKNDVTDIRFMDLTNDAEWGIVNDRIYIQHITGTPPRAFLIHDQIFADTLHMVFNNLWAQAQQWKEIDAADQA